MDSVMFLLEPCLSSLVYHIKGHLATHYSLRQPMFFVVYCLFCLVLFCNKVLCNLSWPPPGYVAKNDLKLLIRSTTLIFKVVRHTHTCTHKYINTHAHARTHALFYETSFLVWTALF